MTPAVAAADEGSSAEAQSIAAVAEIVRTAVLLVLSGVMVSSPLQAGAWLSTHTL
jgi:hypothetical protein